MTRIPETGEGSHSQDKEFRSQDKDPRSQNKDPGVRIRIPESGQGSRSQEKDTGDSHDKDSRDRRRIPES